MFEKSKRWGFAKQEKGGVNEDGNLNKSRCGGKGWEVKGLIDLARGAITAVVLVVERIGVRMGSLAGGSVCRAGLAESK